MVILEAAFVIGLVGLMLFLLLRFVTRSQHQRRPAATTGRWVTAHYDVKGDTRVVVQKISPTGANLLSEHIVATIRISDPEYDAAFLTAMAAARERRALFESEQE